MSLFNDEYMMTAHEFFGGVIPAHKYYRECCVLAGIPYAHAGFAEWLDRVREPGYGFGL